jgi:putative ABC transport system substrate-binding protein
MRRREFITILGGAAAAWPLSGAQSQQAKRVYRVAWIPSISPLSDLVGANPINPFARAFVQGMRELGYLEGKNLAIEWRSPEGKFERLPDIIRELAHSIRDVEASFAAA